MNEIKIKKKASFIILGLVIKSDLLAIDLEFIRAFSDKLRIFVGSE